MIQRLLILFICFSVGNSYAQITYGNLTHDPILRQTSQNNIKKTSTSNQRLNSTTPLLSLPFIEEFSTYEGSADTNKFEANGGTYVNNRYPINPPTLHAATFDGLLEDGNPYDFVSDPPSSDGETDKLISCAIDLSGYTSYAVDRIGFSFYWQKGSHLKENGPDENDSLRLQFLASDSTWQTVWVELGDSVVSDTSVTDFAYVHIAVDAPYYSDFFRFKFESFGRRTGRFDVWSVDYIYMDAGRATTESFTDWGFNHQPESILNEYWSMPYWHFLSELGGGILADSICSSVWNHLANINLFSLSSNLIEETTRGLTQTEVLSEGTTIAPDEVKEFCAVVDKTQINNWISTMNDNNEIILEYALGMQTPDTYAQNDTARNQVALQNYYAYDDGSAENGVGISRIDGRVVVEYDTPFADSLTGIDILWVRHSPDLSSEGIKLMIFQELKGINGGSSDIILFQPSNLLEYQDSLNEFTHYELPTPVYIPQGDYYIGYSQDTDENLLVGFDANTDHMDKAFIDLFGSWTTFQSPSDTTKGSLMIRPVFKKPDAPIVITGYDKALNTLDVQVFPNPAQTSFSTSVAIDRLELSTLSGQLLSEWSNQSPMIHSFDVSSFPVGVYIIRIYSGNQIATKKLIIR